MRTIQISIWQVLFLMAAMIISTGHFLFVRIVFTQAGRDSWVVIVPSVLIGSLVFLAVFRLAKRFPNLTLVEISIRIFGKWFGRAVVLPYLLFFMAVPALVIRAIGDFLPTTMPHTPYGVIITIVVLLACITVRLGIEVIGRCALLMLPILVFLGLVAAVLTMKDKHYEYLLPMFQTPMRGLLQGTATLSGLFSEVMVAGMLVNMVKPKMLKTKTAVLFFALIGFTFIGPMTGPIALFDIESSGKFNYPTYEEIRYIEVANFLERLDVVGILLWASGAFLKIAVFLYALSLGLAQWLGLKDYRPLVIPLAIVLLFQATFFASNREQVWDFLSKVYPLFTLAVGLLLPWLTLLVGRFRKKSASTA